MKPDNTFHLYTLIGQSNMAGRGRVGALDREVHPRVYALNREGQWAPAADPIHFDKPIAGVGPGLAFGKAMADRDPDVRIGLVPCAAGGSPLSVWQPGGYWEQTESHPYDDALARTAIAQQSGVLGGFLWHQGESNSNEQDAPSHLGRLEALIDALRTALNAPQAPFVVATLGDFFVARNAWGTVINQALEQLTQEVACTACVQSAGLDHNGDELHFGAASARELGQRYAQAMAHLHSQGERK